MQHRFASICRMDVSTGQIVHASSTSKKVPKAFWPFTVMAKTKPDSTPLLHLLPQPLQTAKDLLVLLTSQLFLDFISIITTIKCSRCERTTQDFDEMLQNVTTTLISSGTTGRELTKPL